MGDWGMNWKKELRDQSAHMLAGAITVVPSLVFGLGPLTVGWTTLALGLVRELTEWKLNPSHGSSLLSGSGAITSSGSLRDLFFWFLIGFALGCWRVYA